MLSPESPLAYQNFNKIIPFSFTPIIHICNNDQQKPILDPNMQVHFASSHSKQGPLLLSWNKRISLDIAEKTLLRRDQKHMYLSPIFDEHCIPLFNPILYCVPCFMQPPKYNLTTPHPSPVSQCRREYHILYATNIA